MDKQEICVGDRVRSGDDPESATGVVEKIVSTTRVEVSWDYGSTDTVPIDSVELYDVSKLEEQFQQVFTTIDPQIQEKLAEAAKLIDQAVAISEENGLPFRPDERIMFCRPSYIPESFKKKFPGLAADFWFDLAGASGDDEYDGWQTSQVC